MKFASVSQISILVVVSCVGLYALDYWKNPQLWHPAAAQLNAEKGLRLTLWMNHLCCTGCEADLRQALAALPGLDVANAVVPKQPIQQTLANMENASLPDYGNSIEIPVSNLEELDLAALEAAIRARGFVAARMELAGVEHFRLEAEVDHMCCKMCERAIYDRISFLKATGLGQLRWLDSVKVDREKKTIIAYARFLDPGHSVDVAEFVTGMNRIGYAPRSLRVVVGEKNEMMEKNMASQNAPGNDRVMAMSGACAN